MPWYLYLAFKQLFPSGKWISFFAVMSACGVTLGVMLLIIVQSVMNGFGEELRGKIVDTGGHIRVVSTEGDILHDYEPMLEWMEAFDAVSAATPHAEGIVMVQSDRRPSLPLVRGIDPMRESGVINLKDYLIAGSFDHLYDDGVFISSGLASSLGARVGSIIEVYTPLILERIRRDEILLPRELEVVGIFETGWHQVDENTLVVTLRLMQDLYGMNGGVHGLTLRLHDGHDADAVTAAINRELGPDVWAVSWMDTHQDFLWILQLEKNVLFFLLIFIVIVAAFAITSSLLITVVRKIKEIGLLGALGATPRQIALCFCFQGFFIGAVGTVLGIVSAVVLLHFRNDIIHAFARLTESEEALRRFYEFAYIPLHYSTNDFIVIITCTLVISTLAGLIPALRAARLQPTEAFRNE